MYLHFSSIWYSWSFITKLHCFNLPFYSECITVSSISVDMGVLLGRSELVSRQASIVMNDGILSHILLEGRIWQRIGQHVRELSRTYWYHLGKTKVRNIVRRWAPCHDTAIRSSSTTMSWTWMPGLLHKLDYRAGVATHLRDAFGDKRKNITDKYGDGHVGTFLRMRLKGAPSWRDETWAIAGLVDVVLLGLCRVQKDLVSDHRAERFGVRIGGRVDVQSVHVWWCPVRGLYLGWEPLTLTPPGTRYRVTGRPVTNPWHKGYRTLAHRAGKGRVIKPSLSHEFQTVQDSSIESVSGK